MYFQLCKVFEKAAFEPSSLLNGNNGNPAENVLDVSATNYVKRVNARAAQWNSKKKLTLSTEIETQSMGGSFRRRCTH